MAKLLGIDIGTSATKAVLVNESGDVVKSATRTYPVSTPRPGWAEQDPSDWLRATSDCLKEIGERSPDAIGLTGQMHGLVALDAQGSPVRPAILWCDQRTGEECREIDDVLGPESVRAITCNVPTTGFQAPKILWMRRHEQEAFSRSAHYLLPKDYVKWAICGEAHTDVSDASGTGLFDVAKRRWWVEGIRALRLAPETFPPAHESAMVVGKTGKFSILEPGIPIVAGGGDQAAAAVGTGAVVPGLTSVSLGTSGVVFTTIERPLADPSGSVNVFCHANNGWHTMGVMLSCGGAVKWARDTFFPGMNYQEFDALAAKAPVGCDGLTFLPYLAGERCPYNDPNATACLGGLTLAHSRSHIARAVLEGACFGLKGCFDKLNLGRSQVRVTGGGANSPFWLQTLSDVLGCDCVQMKSDGGPAVGAALLAGVGVGVFSDVVQAGCASSVLGTKFTPGNSDYTAPLERFQSLYPLHKGLGA